MSLEIKQDHYDQSSSNIYFVFLPDACQAFATSRVVLCIAEDHVAIDISRLFGVGLATIGRGAHLASPLGLSLISSIAWIT